MDTSGALASLSALSHESRLAVFRELVQAGPEGLSVGELRARVGLPPATLTAQLNLLRAAGLVGDRREGRSVRVSADYAHMDSLIAYLTENCCGGVPCLPAAACKPARRKTAG